MQIIHTKTWRWVELIILTLGIPAVLYFYLPRGLMLGVLWLIALYCHVIYRAIVDAPSRVYWHPEAMRRAHVLPMLQRFAAAALLLGVITWQAMPDHLFFLPREKPGFWLLIMVCYPIISVIPQEIIFRTFFFTRYASIFPTNLSMILASGLSFGLAHLIFHNWVAPLLTAVGGILFARTYSKTHSLLLVTVEHALYGCFLFTIGLGRFFYNGSAHTLAAVAGQ